MEERIHIGDNYAKILNGLMPTLVYNAAANFQTITNNFDDLKPLQDSQSGLCVLAASGPNMIEDLKKLPRDVPIICSQSQIAVLQDAGFYPKFCVVLDPYEGTVEQLERQWDDDNLTMVITPAIHPKAVEIIDRKCASKYVTLELNQGSIWHQHMQVMMYPKVRTQLQPMGSSGSMAYELATFLGFDKIWLAGYAFGVEEGGEARTYHKEDIERKSSQYGEMFPSNREGWLTSENFISYKVGLYVCILNRKVPVAHLTDPGTLEEIPVGHFTDDLKPFKKYLENIGYEFRDNKMVWKG